VDPILQQYAEQAGLINQQPTGEATGIDPRLLEAASAAPPQQPTPGQGFSPITGTMTDEDILASVLPGYAPSDDPSLTTQPSQVDAAGPTVMPQQVPNAGPGNPGSAVTTKVKSGTSVGTSGFSQSKNEQIRKGPGAGIRGEIAGIEAQGDVDAAARAQPFVDSAQNEANAANMEVDASVKHINAAGHQKALLAELTNHYDTQTQEMIVGEQGKAASAKANYVAALNEFRAARVNPSQLWDNMSGGEQLGTLAVAFVQDFLGSQGIHTSAMSTLNKAIERNIDSQVRGIQTKGQVAEGFKGLWDMQMAESSSALEARNRMRGFMLESAKTAIEAHMAQFDAGLATAKGQAMIAKIDQELQKTIFEVNKTQDASTAQRINQAIALYGDELRASMESARISVAREANQIERDKMKAQQGPGDPYADLVFDTTESGQGAPIAQFNDGIKPEEKQKFREKQAISSKLVQLTREYDSLLAKNGNQGLLGGTRWQDSDTARLRNVAYEILNTRIKLQTGAALSEAEAKRIMTSTPTALFGTDFNVRSVVAQTQKHIQDDLAISQQSIARPLHPQDPRRTLPNQRIIQGQAEKTEAGLIESGEIDKKDIQKIINEGYIKGLEKHTANEQADEVPSDVKKRHAQFLAEHPELAASAKNTSSYAPGLPSLAKGPQNFEVAITGLARSAAGVKEKADEGDQHAAALYKEKVAIMKHLASPVISGTNPNDVQGLYALMELHNMGEDVGTTTSESPAEVPTSATAHEEMPR
jgi:hypothetical protein